MLHPLHLACRAFACAAALGVALHALAAPDSAAGAATPEAAPRLMTVDQLGTVLGDSPLVLIKSFTASTNNRWLYARLRWSSPTVVTRDSIEAYVARASGGRSKRSDRRYLGYLSNDFAGASIGANRFEIELGHPARWALDIHPFSVDLELDPRYRGVLVDYWEPSGPGAASAVFRMDEGSFDVRFGFLEKALVRAWTLLTDTETPDFRRARYFLNLNPSYFQMFGVNAAGEAYPLCHLLRQKNSRRVKLGSLTPRERALYDRFLAAIERDRRGLASAALAR